MKPITKNILIASGVVLIIAAGGITTTVLVVNRKRRGEEFERLLNAISNNTEKTGTYVDLGNKGQAFDLRYYQLNSKNATISDAKADEYAQTIYNSHHWYGDDEEKVTAIFRSLISRADVSLIANKFYQKYGQDLYEYLRSFMESNLLGFGHNYMDDIYNYIKQLKA
jgi:hypothetical protein